MNAKPSRKFPWFAYLIGLFAILAVPLAPVASVTVCGWIADSHGCKVIGTYLKALAARDNNVPFYVALPSSSVDWKIRDGLKEIPIEQRGVDEVKHADGWLEGRQVEVHVAPEGSPAANFGFDVTPRHLVTGLITERGVCEANEESIRSLFPEHGL
jgi:methylthioribose-1-phosphate isomerase